MSRLRAIYACFVCLPLLAGSFSVSAQTSTSTTTTINIGGTAVQTGVKRLGMNLGAVNFYDSGQMLKNLVVSNPSFEGQIAQSMILCGSGTISSCTDSMSYTGWPADFWDGATYTFVYGTALGRTGTISTFTNTNNATPGVFNFSDSTSATPSNGDYMIVKKAMPSGATEGWNYITGGNGSVTSNTTDLPPGTLGIQTIALNAPSQGDNANLYYYFDSTAGQTFLQLNGNYTLSFKAKATAGSNSVYVSLARLNYPATVYINQTVALTNSWQTYTIPFTGSDAGVIATAELQFVTAAPGSGYPASSFELDDVSLVQTSNQDPTNTTVFRDPVVNTLKQLNPGVLRFWFNQEGETLDNFLAPDTGRQRSAYSAYGASGDINTPYVEYSLAEFLQLCQVVGSSGSSPIEPWVVIPVTLSTTEASNLIDYLAGPSTTVYGGLRAAAGQTAPWTSVFPKIHLEFGNEAWNNLFYGGSMANGPAYGTRAQTVFAAMQANANYSASSFDLMINGNAFNPYGEASIQYYCNNNTSFAAQPYLMLNANDPAASNLTGAAATENLFGSLLAEPEAFVTASGTAEGISNGLVLQSQAAAGHVPFAVTETNISPYGGSITQAELNSFVSSMGAGLAVVDTMLQNMRVGVLTQNIFALPGWNYFRGDGKSMYLFGSVVDMGVTNLQRPQFLTEELANNAIGASTTMLQTAQTGLNPTWNVSSVNSVQFNNAHYLQSFAFSGGDNYSLIILNTNRSASEQVNFGGVNVPGGTVQMTQLTSTNITDTNETAPAVIAPVSSTLTNFSAATGMTLPPFSMTVLTWSAPAISNVAVSGITGTSATITWTTDTASTSQVNYGTTTSYGLQATSGGSATSHSVTLTGLSAGTSYDFAVSSTNAAGATAGSANAIFGTPASFTISAAGSISVQQGYSASVPVTVTLTNGYTGSVTLSVTGLPTGASGTFQTGSGSAALVISVGTTVPAATYSLTVVGTAGSTVVSVPLSLVVSQTAATGVNLASSANVYGIFSDGSTVTNGGLDGGGYAYSANLLGSSLSLGISYSFGTPGTANAASSITLPLSAGNYANLNFLGTGVNGSQLSQTFVVTYTDGTTSTFTQSLSDWGAPQSYPGENIAIKTTYRVTPSGGQSAGPWSLYEYSFPLNSAKTVQSFTLPNNRNVIVLAVTLSGSGSNQAQTITFNNVATQTVGTPLALTATASSGLAVTYASSTTSVCTVSGSTATFLAAGTCSITASQAGNSSYAAATPVTQSFTVQAVVTSTAMVVSLGSAANVYGIFSNGSAVTNGGLDTASYAYSSNLLGASLTFQGIPYSFGTPGTANAASSTTVTLPSGSYSTLNFLGAAVFGNQASQTFTVTYTDGTTSTFSQGISDWGSPQSYTYETIASTMAYRVTSTGSQQNGPWYLYAYSFTLNSAKTVKSFTLPNSRNVTVLAVTLSGPVSNNTQTITFGAIPAQTVGTPLTLTATASSSLAVSYSSSTTSICTVSGSTATFLAAGTCTITASQAGNSSYAAATSVTQSITVNAASLKSQTITFGSVAAQTVGTPLTLSATASSGLAVSYASSTTSVCTVSGSTATFVAAGTCTITASQAGNATYAAAGSVSQSFNVLATQTITFGSIAAQTVGTPLTLSATASSGLAVSYSSSTASVCTVSGSTTTFVAAGTCTITASQAGNSSYAAATPVSQNITVSAVALKSQTITFGAIAAQTVGTPLTLSATASSGLAVSYTSSTTSVCTVSGSTATFLAAGTCTITASQAGNSSYAAATPVSQSITVNAALKSQTITFGSIAAQTVGTPLTLSASASSGLTVSYASSTTSVCTVSGSTATFIAAGTCTITASQAGNSSYAAATPVSQSITVNAALKSQTITFGSIAAQTVGTPLTLTAIATSGLAVSYASSTTSVCTVSGSTATFIAAGTCTITASQAGNSSYAAATAVSQSFTVQAATTSSTNTTVSLGSSANVYGIFNNGSSVTNGGLDTSSYAYSANLLGTSLTFQGIPYTFGTAGSADAVTSAMLTLPSGSYSTLNFLGAAVSGNQASATFTVTYTDGTTSTFKQGMSDWGSPQSYTGESKASSMSYRVTPSGGQQTGPWYLYAYSFTLNSAKTVKSFTLPNSRNVVVLAVTLSGSAGKTAQTITFGSIATQTAGKTLALTAIASSGLAVSYASSTTSICTVSSSTATFLTAGTCTITASQAGNSTYAAATSVSQSFTVQSATTAVSLASVSNVYGIFANGSSISNGGLDNDSYAYSSTLLASSLTAGGVPFTLGTPGAADAVSSVKVTLSAGTYSTLNFLATAVNSAQTSQKFTVTYTDGTTTVATQSLSDWGQSQSYTGESTAASMTYRLTPTGGQQTGPWYLYAYSIALNSAKTVQSITLPSNRNVVVLAITLSH